MSFKLYNSKPSVKLCYTTALNPLKTELTRIKDVLERNWNSVKRQTNREAGRLIEKHRPRDTVRMREK